MSTQLDETGRKEAFLILVGLQDSGSTVEESRDAVATQFDIPVADVRGIEQDGIQNAWPPLE